MWRERRQDVVLTTVLALTLVAFNLSAGRWLTPVVVVIGCMALFWRRRFPIAVFALVALAFTASILWHLEAGSPLLFITWIALYGVPVYASPRQANATIAVVCAAAIAVMIRMGSVVDKQTEGSLVIAILLTAAYIATPWLLGRYHVQLRRETKAVAAQATAEERARIARELHDMLAHTMSGMVVLAGGARRIARTKPEAAAVALARIEEAGRRGMTETRMLLDSLRDGSAPTLDNLSTLIDEVRGSGLSVVVSTDGEPAVVPLTVGVAAYRIVQESLTNIRRHAGPATARVGLEYRPGALEIEIADDGRGGEAAPGNGLAGMRERACLAGGQFRAGPRPGGGWLVHAIFPVIS
jgi:signal transduction histidine kinase